MGDASLAGPARALPPMPLTRRLGPAGGPRAVPVLLAVLAGISGPPLLAPARAELPPWVYGQEQRQAPLRAEALVLRVQLDAGRQVRAQLRLLRIQRQPPPAGLRSGQTIRLAYVLPPERPQGWAGPAALPLLRPGQRLPVWLTADPADPALFRPAAGGRSFGPSLEEARAGEDPAGGSRAAPGLP
ncbi:MAG: hypothetical protein RLZZ219_1818 [Cyanobacteriota bacterium]